MTNPAMILPDAMPAIQALISATYKGGVDPRTLAIVHLRASLINGCTACIDSGMCHARQGGESDARLDAVATWRTSNQFNDAERAALALTESVTRISDRENPVSDEVWNEAKRHYDESAMAALVLFIATTNLFNRLNVATGQVAANW
jgi:AhpD family alkylhydroperoxidase